MAKDDPSRASTDDVAPSALAGERSPTRTATLERRAPTRDRVRWHVVAAKSFTLLVALFLFILAIDMMKVGAGSVSPHLQLVKWNALATLGLGALLAYMWLSGKPVAAFALTLFASGGLTKLQAFTMLSGGRLGAAFIVLLVGFLYAIRSKNRRESIGVGVLAMTLTAVVYIPGMMLGYAILKTGMLDHVDLTSSKLQGLVQVVFDPIVNHIESLLRTLHGPLALLLPLGGVVIVVAIKMLDRLLPEIDGGRRAQANGRGMRGQWPMFAMGFGITLITFSVSVALTVLVPLAAKGYVTRQEAIPYIMGSNVATLADTLLVAIVVGNPVGIQIVLAEAIGVAIVTALYLAFVYKPLCRGMSVLDDYVVGTNRRLWTFVSALFVLPAILIALGLLLGPLTG